MYHACTMRFSEWIVAELERRGWSRSEAARRGGISPSMFDKVINGANRPGMKFVEGLAKAFGISRAEVLARMENRPPDDEWVEEMNYLIGRIRQPQRRSWLKKLVSDFADQEEAEKKGKERTGLRRPVKDDAP